MDYNSHQPLLAWHRIMGVVVPVAPREARLQVVESPSAGWFSAGLKDFPSGLGWVAFGGPFANSTIWDPEQLPRCRNRALARRLPMPGQRHTPKEAPGNGSQTMSHRPHPVLTRRVRPGQAQRVDFALQLPGGKALSALPKQSRGRLRGRAGGFWAELRGPVQCPLPPPLGAPFPCRRGWEL